MEVTAELRLERTYAVPRARVFDAWSNPEVLRRWWGAGPDWHSPEVEVDLRAGGRYRLSMADPSSDAVYTVGGEYLEVTPPERLVYTWQWETEGSPTRDLATLVTVEFHDTPEGGTNVVLTHSGFADDRQRDLHREGWDACLANLVRRVLEAE